MEEAIESDKKSIHQADTRARELLARTDCLVKIEKDVQQCCSAMEDAMEQQGAIKDNNHMIKDLQLQAEAARSLQRELETRITVYASICSLRSILTLPTALEEEDTKHGRKEGEAATAADRKGASHPREP